MSTADMILTLIPLDLKEAADFTAASLFQVSEISLQVKDHRFALITAQGTKILHHDDVIEVQEQRFQVEINEPAPPHPPRTQLHLPRVPALHQWEQAQDPLGFLYGHAAAASPPTIPEFNPGLDTYLSLIPAAPSPKENLAPEVSSNILQELGIPEASARFPNLAAKPGEMSLMEPSPWDMADELLTASNCEPRASLPAPRPREALPPKEEKLWQTFKQISHRLLT